MNKKRIIIIATMVFVLAVMGTSAVIVINRNNAENNPSVEITGEELAVGSDIVNESNDEIIKDDSNNANETTEDAVNKTETTNDKADTTESNKKSDKKDDVAKNDNKNENATNSNDITNQAAASNSNNNSNATTEGTKPTVTAEPTIEGQKPTTTSAPITTESQKQNTTTAPTTTENPKPATTNAPNTTESQKPSTTQAATTEKEKVWHEPVYEDVWVVDDPGGDVPIYEYHTFCNQCHTDLTASGVSWGTHCNSTLNPDGSLNCWSYTTGVPVQSGTKHYDEVGHWEQKLIKDGYWE